MDSPVRVLVVEDDYTVLMNLTVYLEDEGLEAIPVTSAENAIRVVGLDARIDIALVDMRLPGMDGEDLIVRLHGEWPELKFLIHTGSANYVLPRRLRVIGMQETDVLQKPLSDMGRLKSAIERLMESKDEQLRP